MNQLFASILCSSHTRVLMNQFNLIYTVKVKLKAKINKKTKQKH